jgi:CRISPR-associated protein Cas6/Cse3/CasE subtype I-E
MRKNNTLAEISILARSASDAYAAHQVAWSIIGQSPDKTRHFHHDYQHLPANQGALITVRALSQYLPQQAKVIQTRYENGTALNFTLAANASICRGKKKEVACLTKSELLDWIMRQASVNGFHVHQESIDVDTQPSLIRKPGKPVFFLNRAHFTGTLTVTDSDTFAQALVSGIGRHRGLGFGMLKIINNKSK